MLRNDIYGPTLFSEVLRYAESVRPIVESEAFDVIHAHDWLSFLAGIEARRISGKPLVLHVHASGFELSGGGGIDDRIFTIEREGMLEADAVVTVSDRTKQIVTDRYGIPSEKIHVIHNGIDDAPHKSETPQSFPFKRDGWKIVLYVGRLTLHKGPDYFLRAAKRVLEYNPQTYFVIAGSGDMEWQMIRLSSELGIADKVFFTGFLRGDELYRMYRTADVYVLPSVSEPFGLTPLEALVHGNIPVLVSKQSGVSEVLQNALKVDFWDVEEMANKILMALRYPVLSRQLGEYGSFEALSLTWRRAAQKCVDLYNTLLEKVRGTAHTQGLRR
jgi:glycosyltransferase involved in cell wall biosynthesis